jgi:hypothetical protein
MIHTLGIPGVAALALVACNPDPNWQPSGQVTLKLSQSSQAGLVFELSNRTTRDIWFDALPEAEKRVRPFADAVNVECRQAGSAGWVKQAPSLGVYRNGEGVRVLPGGSRQLVIDRDFVARFENGVCRMELSLAEGLVLVSNDFSSSPTLAGRGGP